MVAYASLGCGDLLAHPAVGAVAAEVGRSPAQVLLRWALQVGAPGGRGRGKEEDGEKDGSLGAVLGGMLRADGRAQVI